jgi:hypothetical protein
MSVLVTICNCAGSLTRGFIKWRREIKCILFLPVTILALICRYTCQAVMTTYSVISGVFKTVFSTFSCVQWLSLTFIRKLTPVANKIQRIFKPLKQKIRRWPILNVILRIPWRLLGLTGLFIKGLAAYLVGMIAFIMIFWPITYIFGPVLASLEYSPGVAIDTTAAASAMFRAFANFFITLWNACATILNPILPYEWVFVTNAFRMIINIGDIVTGEVGIAPAHPRSLTETIYINGLPHSRNLQPFADGDLGPIAEGIGIGYAVTAGTINNVVQSVLTVLLQTIIAIITIVLKTVIPIIGFFIRVASTLVQAITCIFTTPSAFGCVLLEVIAGVLNKVLTPISQFLSADLTIPVCGSSNIPTTNVPCGCSAITGGPLSALPSCPSKSWVCYSTRSKGFLVYGEYDSNSPIDFKARKGATATNMQQGCPNYLRTVETGRRLFDEEEDEEKTRCFYSETHDVGWLIEDKADTSSLIGKCELHKSGEVMMSTLTDTQRKLHYEKYLTLPHVTKEERDRFNRQYVPRPKEQATKKVTSRPQLEQAIQTIIDTEIRPSDLGIDCTNMKDGDNSYVNIVYKLICFVRKTHHLAMKGNGLAGLILENKPDFRKLEEEKPVIEYRSRRYLEEIADSIDKDIPLTRKLQEIHSTIYDFHKTIDSDAYNYYEHMQVFSHVVNSYQETANKQWEEIKTAHRNLREKTDIQKGIRRHLVSAPDSHLIGDLGLGGCGTYGRMCPDGSCAKDDNLDNCKTMTTETLTASGTIRYASYQVENVFTNLNPIEYFESTWACYQDIIRNPDKNPATLRNMFGRTWRNVPGPGGAKSINYWNPSNIRWCPGLIPWISTTPLITWDFNIFINEQCRQMLNPPEGVQPCTCPQYISGPLLQDMTSQWLTGIPTAVAGTMFNGYKGYQYLFTALFPSAFLSSTWQTILFFFPGSLQTPEVVNVFNPEFASAGMSVSANSFCLFIHSWSIYCFSLFVYIFLFTTQCFLPFVIALLSIALDVVWIIIKQILIYFEWIGAQPLDPDAVLLGPEEDDDEDDDDVDPKFPKEVDLTNADNKTTLSTLSSNIGNCWAWILSSKAQNEQDVKKYLRGDGNEKTTTVAGSLKNLDL